MNTSARALLAQNKPRYGLDAGSNESPVLVSLGLDAESLHSLDVARSKDKFPLLLSVLDMPSMSYAVKHDVVEGMCSWIIVSRSKVQKTGEESLPVLLLEQNADKIFQIVSKYYYDKSETSAGPKTAILLLKCLLQAELTDPSCMNSFSEHAFNLLDTIMKSTFNVGQNFNEDTTEVIYRLMNFIPTKGEFNDKRIVPLLTRVMMDESNGIKNGLKREAARALVKYSAVCEGRELLNWAPTLFNIINYEKGHDLSSQLLNIFTPAIYKHNPDVVHQNIAVFFEFALDPSLFLSIFLLVSRAEPHCLLSFLPQFVKMLHTATRQTTPVIFNCLTNVIIRHDNVEAILGLERDASTIQANNVLITCTTPSSKR
jgi:hypothetical protein